MATFVFVDGVCFVPAKAEPKRECGDRRQMLTALDVRFTSDAGDNLTVREYLCRLLAAVWEEEEGFDGKRPFGNSGWQRDVYAALIGAGFIEGKLDSNGSIDHYDRAAAEKYVLDLISLVSDATMIVFSPAGQPHMSRVLTEKVELDERIGKLVAFFDTPIFSGLPEAERGRLRAQHTAMADYSKILGERIAAFTTNA